MGPRVAQPRAGRQSGAGLSSAPFCFARCRLRRMCYRAALRARGDSPAGAALATGVHGDSTALGSRAVSRRRRSRARSVRARRARSSALARRRGLALAGVLCLTTYIARRDITTRAVFPTMAYHIKRCPCVSPTHGAVCAPVGMSSPRALYGFYGWGCGARPASSRAESIRITSISPPPDPPLLSLPTHS